MDSAFVRVSIATDVPTAMIIPMNNFVVSELFGVLMHVLTELFVVGSKFSLIFIVELWKTFLVRVRLDKKFCTGSFFSITPCQI